MGTSHSRVGDQPHPSAADQSGNSASLLLAKKTRKKKFKKKSRRKRRPKKNKQTKKTISPAEKKARAHFAEAEKSFNTGHFKEALFFYEAAYDAMALPAFLFNMAQCHRYLENPERALFFYRRYLTLEKKVANRPLVESLITEEEEKLAIAEKQKQRQSLVEAEARGRATPIPVGALPVDSKSANAKSEDKTPITKKWWFWTTIAVFAAGAVTAAVLFTSRPHDPAGDLDSIDGR